MVSKLDHLWAGWRSNYVSSSSAETQRTGGCVFCDLMASDAPATETFVVTKNKLGAAILNAYPYGTGHVLLLPRRHVGQLDELTPEESLAVWQLTQDAIAAIKQAYGPDGFNIGANLGTAGGAGIPDHLHMHALPRWNADTNFSTTIANTRILPEPLGTTLEKLQAAWPS